MENKYLLVEDDVAPDSKWYFEKLLKEKFNLTILDFKEKGVKVSTEDNLAFYYNGYVLESFAEEPYWHLRYNKNKLN